MVAGGSLSCLGSGVPLGFHVPVATLVCWCSMLPCPAFAWEKLSRWWLQFKVPIPRTLISLIPLFPQDQCQSEHMRAAAEW